MYIGVDTRKKTHVLVALDAQGQTCGTRTVGNTPAGWAAALRSARDLADASIWGIENTGSLGKGFAQFLLGSGETAVHKIVPHRTAQYRKRGRTQDKTDFTDALAMACLPRADHRATVAQTSHGRASPRLSKSLSQSRIQHGHRLNRGGNRQLNRVFHMIALCQLRCEPLAQAYYAKKRAEGKTARSARRCLKRRLVDVIFRLLPITKPTALATSMRTAA